MLTEIITRQKWPEQAKTFIINSQCILSKYPSEEKEFFSLLEAYFLENKFSLVEIQRMFKAIGDTTGIHVYTLCLLFCLNGASYVKTAYAKQHIPEEVFWKTIEDFKWKMLECFEVHGVYGTFVFGWYENIFRLRCFGLGRLQFEKALSPVSFEADGVSIKRGDPIINMHIPSSGPLPYEACIDSYKRAYAFFGANGIFPLYCSSWLLYEGYNDVFAGSANIQKFRSSFKIVHNDHKESFDDAWRIFGTNDTASFVAVTALQKNMLSHIKAKADFGIGNGFILFDGLRVLPPQ